MRIDAEVGQRASTINRGPQHATDHLPLGQRSAVVSRLFATLVSSVDRRRLAADRAYFALVSEIAELLSNDEVALLALYFAPPLAIGIPSREHQMALAIIRERRKGNHHV